MKRVVLSMMIVACLAIQSQAQQAPANYGQMQMNAIKGQNSAHVYSSQRLRNNVYSSAVPRFNFSGVNRNLFSGVTSQPSMNRQKPFSQVQRGSSASPYMGLISDNPFTSTTTNYFNNVRPKLDQQRVNDQLMAQNIKMQQQLQQLATRPPYDPTGDDDRAPTGHSAVFQQHGGMYGNPGGYYPQVPIRSVRGQR